MCLKGGEKIVMMIDTNSHLHSEAAADVAHAIHFRRALKALGLTPDICMGPLITYSTGDGAGVQDDYIVTTTDVRRCNG